MSVDGILRFAVVVRQLIANRAHANPVEFSDLLDAIRDQKYRAILMAWSDMRTRHALERDEYGRYWCAKQ